MPMVCASILRVSAKIHLSVVIVALKLVPTIVPDTVHATMAVVLAVKVSVV